MSCSSREPVCACVREKERGEREKQRDDIMFGHDLTSCTPKRFELVINFWTVRNISEFTYCPMYSVVHGHGPYLKGGWGWRNRPKSLQKEFGPAAENSWYCCYRWWKFLSCSWQIAIFLYLCIWQNLCCFGNRRKLKQRFIKKIIIKQLRPMISIRLPPPDRCRAGPEGGGGIPGAPEPQSPTPSLPCFWRRV